MRKFEAFSIYTLAALVLTGSIAIAAGSKDQKSTEPSEKTKSHSSQQQNQSTSQQSQKQLTENPVMDSHSSTIIFAAVYEVDQEQNTVTLVTSDGNKMEMELSKEALSKLQDKDIVEVTIDKRTAVSIDKVQDAQKSTSSDKARQSQQSSGDRMSAQRSSSSDAASATVEAIDAQQGKLTLQMEKSGKTVEMQVPEELISELQRGDSVEVSIRKSELSRSGDPQSSKSKSK